MNLRGSRVVHVEEDIASAERASSNNNYLLLESESAYEQREQG